MPCVQEFGIIDRFDPQYPYDEEYLPEQYGCVAVDDDYIDDWWEGLAGMKVYFGSLDRPETGLARYGITLIPPESLGMLYDAVKGDPLFAERPDLPPLLGCIEEAMRAGKWMIHYGV